MMKISVEAKAKIDKALKGNPGKSPRLVLKKGGCAGNMLVLLLEKIEDSDEFVEASGIKFAIAENAMPFVDNISIELKTGLCEEIVVKLGSLPTCKCGKSFRLS